MHQPRGAFLTGSGAAMGLALEQELAQEQQLVLERLLARPHASLGKSCKCTSFVEAFSQLLAQRLVLELLSVLGLQLVVLLAQLLGGDHAFSLGTSCKCTSCVVISGQVLEVR